MADAPSATTISPPVSIADQGTNLLREVGDLVGMNPEQAPSASDLQAKFHELLAGFESACARAGIQAEDSAAAKYAYVALIDETVMLSPLPAKDAWMEQPLQLKYFDEMNAGEEFYNRIDHLRALRKTDVLEVYWLCMAFGFKGKHADKKGVQRRRALMESLQAEIAQARGLDAKSPLSHRAHVPMPPLSRPSRLPLLRLPLWVVPLTVAVLVVAAWLLLDLYASSGLDAVAGAAGPAPAASSASTNGK